LALRSLASDLLDITVLAPYLSSQVGDAVDVMPKGEHAIPHRGRDRSHQSAHASRLRRTG
jgi:hypothetical protein